MTATNVQPIPQDMHTITPHIVCAGASDALAWYARAFGAVELSRMPGPTGKLMHASMRIGNSVVMLTDEEPAWKSFGPNALGGTPVTLHMYVEHCDAAFQRAAEAGATPFMPPTDMFWGDRYSMVVDPWGHRWAIATHIRDVTPEQMMTDMQKMFDQNCAPEQEAKA